MSLHRSELKIQEGLQRFDVPARKLAKEVVPKVCNFINHVDEHPNKYSIDMIGYGHQNDAVCYIEVEVSHSWNQTNFPWPCLSYLEERKGRYLYDSEYIDLDMYFVMFNRNFTSFAITDRQSILKSPIRQDNRSWKGIEKFRMISRNNFSWFVIENLK